METKRQPVQARTKIIVNHFEKIAPGDRKLAIEAVSAERSISGRDSLLRLYEHPTVQTNQALKEKTLEEIKARPEIDTPQKLLARIQKKPALLNAAVLRYLDEKLGDVAAADLLRIAQKEPSVLTPNLISYFQKYEYQAAHALILTNLAKRPSLITPAGVEYFIKHKEKQAPEKFLQAVQKDSKIITLEQIPNLFLVYHYQKAAFVLLKKATKYPNQITDSLFNFFGKMRYTQAVPLIKKELAEHNFIESGIQALADMQSEELNLYILALGRDQNPKLRLVALQTIAKIESPRTRRRALADMQNILRFHTKEPKKVIWAALEFFERSPYEARSFELLKIVYKKNPKKETKERALKAMAAMRRLSLAAMRRAMQRGIGPADAHLALDRYQKKYRVLKRTKTPIRRKKLPKSKFCRLKRSYSTNYPNRLRRQFATHFGKELGRVLRKRLHHALQSFADGGNATSALVFRAYQNYLGLDKQEIKIALQKGLQYPGSLSAIVWRVHVEYANDSMRSYALASMFGVERWKAMELLSLIRKKCL